MLRAASDNCVRNWEFGLKRGTHLLLCSKVSWLPLRSQKVLLSWASVVSVLSNKDKQSSWYFCFPSEQLYYNCLFVWVNTAGEIRRFCSVCLYCHTTVPGSFNHMFAKLKNFIIKLQGILCSDCKRVPGTTLHCDFTSAHAHWPRLIV